MSRYRCVALVPVLALVALAAWTHADKPPKADSADKDYAAELPRIAPREPAEALKSFQLREGFRIDLVAAEPLVQSPVALDFDENGRMFVVEYPEYNQYANKNYKGRGRVRLLEDSDGDGRYDKSSIYVDNLETPTAVVCYDGGIFVGTPPDILFCKDTKGDGKVDVRKPIYTGFGRDHAGEGMLNSFHWGLDNRFHISPGLDGGNVRRADQKDGKSVSVRGQGFLFDPRSLAFELTGGGGQHGMSMDDWGRKFVCGNSEPTHLVMYDSRYIARNPYLQAPAAAVNIAADGKYTKLMRISPLEPWRVLRTKLRSQGVVKGSDEGGQPSGFFTGATGVTVYRGDAWPVEFRGSVLVGEVANNLVYRARVEANGVGLTARRADADREFLASKDIWFRPVQFANGPDGSLYVIDMYRELIEGAAFLPPQILKHIDVSSGIDRGRIYRIVPEGFKQPKFPKLGQATTAELVALLEHANGWHRDTASRLLYQRQDRAAVAPLKKLATEATSALARTHARYALDGLKALDATIVLKALDDAEPRAREHALRLAERFEADPAIRARLEKMVDDPDLRVRYQLAFSLGNVAAGDMPRRDMPSRVLAKLALRDGGDPWMRLAILSSTVDRAGQVFGLLLADQAFRSSAHGKTFLTTLAGQIGTGFRQDKGPDNSKVGDFVVAFAAIEALPEGDKPLTVELVRSIASQLPAETRKGLFGEKGKTAVILADLIRDARKTAIDDKADVPKRVAAIRTLGLDAFADARPLFEELTQLRQPQPVQVAALETLARFDEPAVPSLVIEAWPRLSPQLRATAAETLFARPAWINAFLEAVEKGKVGRGDVDPARLTLLQTSPDAKIRSRAAQLFAGVKLAKRQEVVDAYQKALTLKGDAARGKAIFKKECSACHQLEGVGHSIGADLSAIRDRGTEAIMLNIIDPNREVKPQFLSYVLSTTSGRIVTGMISAETANSITIRRSDATDETVLRIQVEDLRSTGLSFMPEGLEKQVDLQGMADLLAYLNATK